MALRTARTITPTSAKMANHILAHHGHHHADDVFTSWGVETARKFTKEELTAALKALADEETYGTVLRAKGIVAGEEQWLHFDYVPEEWDVREGAASVTGRHQRNHI